MFGIIMPRKAPMMTMPKPIPSSHEMSTARLTPPTVVAMLSPRNSSGDRPIGSPALRSCSDFFSFHSLAPTSCA